MADLILPDPRMEMPDLLVPGRKPVGDVVVRPSSPWACYSLLDGHTNYDLLKKRRYVTEQSVQRVTTAGLSSNLTRSGSDPRIDIPLDVSSGKISVVIVGLYDIYSAVHTLLGTYSTADAGGVQFRISSAGKLELIKQSVSVIAQPSHPAITTGEIFVAGLSFDNGVSYAMYLNGKKIDSGSTVSCTLSELYLAFRHTADYEQWSGAAIGVMATDAALSAPMMIEATENPYRYLIPA